MGHGTRIGARSLLAAAALFAILESAHAVAPAISAGSSHSLALHADGTVSAWGNDLSGQLGVGRTLKYSRPVEVSGIKDVQSVAVGGTHVLAATKDGTVWSWGQNASAQLGDGTFSPRAAPARVEGIGKVVAVAAGNSFSLALGADGTVWSWGSNYSGELGDPALTADADVRKTPGRIPGLSDIVAIAAGSWHGVALAKDGSIWTWGANDRGQLGDGTTKLHIAPAKVTGITDATAISAGGRSSLMLRQDGTVWGTGAAPGMCLGNSTDVHSFTPTRLSNAKSISGGTGHTLALLNDGTVLACGENNPPFSEARDPLVKGGLTGIVAVCAAGYHSMALRSDGKVFTWGYNTDGQLGNGTTSSDQSSIIQTAGIDGVTALACGTDEDQNATTLVDGVGISFAQKADGTLWMFGNNVDGLAGDGKSVQRSSPGHVSGLQQVVGISAGYRHSLAVRSDGTVWGWGDNGGGQLNLPQDVTNVSTPTQVPDVAGAVAVSAGIGRSLALLGNGLVLSWGSSLANSQFVHDFEAVPGLSGVIAISQGSAQVALRSDGTVWTWGGNESGELGDGTTTDRPTPAAVPGLADVVAISAHRGWTLALKRDGTVWGWGYNIENALTSGSQSAYLSPIRIANLSDVKAISAGGNGNLALKSDGSIWTWGYRTGGTVQSANSLIAAAISVGDGHSLALKPDGTVWAWGGNSDGELGNGTLLSSADPTVVIAEDGAGSIEGNDWFLDLDPSVPSVIPAEFIPAFLVVTIGEPANSAAQVQFRAKDVGKTGSVYVFALTTTASSMHTKDGACQLAQIGSNGQLVPVDPSNLQAAITGILGAQGQLVTILNNASASQYPNSTFFVGYGTTSSDMFDNGTARGVVTLGDGSTCTLPTGFTTIAYPGPLSGLWWNSGESGWGIDFTQRRDVIFAAWYTYDTTGNSKWYVASSCTMAAAAATSGTCSGTLYEVTGPIFFGATFDPKAVKLTTAGSLNVNFASASTASMTYTLGSQSRTVNIERQVFASGPTPGVDYTDLWWNPNESGWGIAVSQQANVMFLTWFVYDAGGEPVWYVASACAVSGNGCSGPLYRTTGPAFGPSFDPTSVHVSTVGTVSLAFTDPNNGTLTYTVNGTSGTKSITRQMF
jgi:alpha-tubulin suppressor-like RCC1 family protein